MHWRTSQKRLASLKARPAYLFAYELLYCHINVVYNQRMVVLRLRSPDQSVGPQGLQRCRARYNSAGGQLSISRRAQQIPYSTAP